MTDWDLENEIIDNDEMDYIDFCAECDELSDWQKDKLQGIEEMKLSGKMDKTGKFN